MMIYRKLGYFGCKSYFGLFGTSHESAKIKPAKTPKSAIVNGNEPIHNCK
jgi:hypothetical protein